MTDVVRRHERRIKRPTPNLAREHDPETTASDSIRGAQPCSQPTCFVLLVLAALYLLSAGPRRLA